MELAVHQISRHFVGEVSGLDLTRPLTVDEFAAVRDAIDRHGVLVFHDQALTDAQQIAFTRGFGAIENSAGGHVAKAHQRAGSAWR